MIRLQTADVHGVRFSVPESWTKEDVAHYWNLQCRGVIIRCPQCGRIDIDLRDHFDECNPAQEQHLREQREHDWK